MVAHKSLFAAVAAGSSFVTAYSYDSAAASQYSGLAAEISSLGDSSLVASVFSNAFASATDGSFSDAGAAASIISNALASASNVVYSTTTSSSASSSITAAPSSSVSYSANSTSTITAKPQTTVSLFNACSGPDTDCKSLTDLTYIGAVITADKSQTIYELDCAQQGKNGTTQCFSHPLTVTQGPSVFARVDDSGAVPTTVSCSIESRTASAVCSESYKATGTGAVGTITASASAPKYSGNATATVYTFDFDSSEIHYNPLIITKGAEKLNGNGTIASRTPTGPTTSLAAPTSTHKSGAGALTAPAASLAGVAALVFAVFAL